jgi:hypothetical protein
MTQGGPIAGATGSRGRRRAERLEVVFIDLIADPDPAPGDESAGVPTPAPLPT